MGLYEKAKQYMYEKKIEVLNNLEKRQFRHVFEEDEHLIGLIIKECNYLLRKGESNDVCMNKIISSFVFNNTISLNSKDFIDGFISLLKEELNIDSFLFYNNQDKRCVLDEVSKETWTYGYIKDVFKPSDFNISNKKEQMLDNEGNILKVVGIDFLSLLKEHCDEDEFSVSLDGSNIEAFCVLDDNSKPFVIFVFASENVDFPKEDILDSLKMASFIFYYFYTSKIATEYENNRNNFSYILHHIESLLDKNSSIYINTFKLKHLVTSKKFKDNNSDLYKNIDDVLADTKNIENIFRLGNYHYITITDNEMLSKQNLESFRGLIDRLRKDVCSTISFAVNRVEYPSKRFISRDEFMDYLMFLLETGEAPQSVIGKKTALAATRATTMSTSSKKPIPSRTKKTIVVKYKAKKTSSNNNTDGSSTAEVSTSKKK